MDPLILALLSIIVASPPMPDFELPNAAGGTIRHSAVANRKPSIVCFLGVDCPLANLYAVRLNDLVLRFPPGAVSLVAIDPNSGDDLAAMAEFAARRSLKYPLLKDGDGRIAERFAVDRTPTVVLLDGKRQIRYRGRIDDQHLRGGAQRGSPTREDLFEAVRELLAGKPISVPETEATGCLIDRPSSNETTNLTYSRDVEPIVAANCRRCHQKGEVGPFPLLTYADARSHARMIAEVVAEGSMPPWHASPEYGKFRNARRLTEDQKRVVAEWVRGGAPEGNPVSDIPRVPTSGWKIGTPDAIFRLPREVSIPKEGVVPYQHFLVDTGYATDVWVKAFEVRPGNRRVVHHVNVYLQPSSAAEVEEYFETGELGSFFLAGFTPGTGPVEMPDGMAKRIPAGSRLHFVIHYTPIGTPEADRTELGLRLVEPSTVRKEIATKVLLAEDIAIPPHNADYRVERTWTAPKDVQLLSMFPHMHARGKSVRYSLEFEDGRSEILLDVPHYDFNWQHWYELAEPIRIPAGASIRAVAVYDNSEANPSNPDPSASVKTGPQSWDEMFNMYFDVTLADEDLVAARAAERLKAMSAMAMTLTAAAVGLLFVIRRIH